MKKLYPVMQIMVGVAILSIIYFTMPSQMQTVIIYIVTFVACCFAFLAGCSMIVNGIEHLYLMWRNK